MARPPAGQATAEFALVLPILLLLLLAIVDFGRLVAVQSAVITASREGARYGSAVGPAPSPAASGTPRYRDCAGIDAAARQAVSALVEFPAVTVQYDRPPSTTAHGSCGSSPAPSIAPLDRVVVTVNAAYAPISPMVRLLVPTINVQSIDRRTIGIAQASPAPSATASISPSPSPSASP